MNKREAERMAAFEAKVEEANRRLLTEVNEIRDLCAAIAERLHIIETERLAAILAATAKTS